ncbi:MAG: FAD-binding protein [Bacteroidales bacterium]|nr:FAD-binding protein [Bacteroidales bacterium]
MINEYQIRILPEQAASEQSIKAFVARDKGMDVRTIRAVRILKKSIDARQRTIFVNLTIRVFVNEDPTEEEYTPVHYRDVSDAPEVIVVGAGPGGLFAALRLIELGLRPIVIERGKDVRERKKDIARIRPEQRVDPESNYSFGEGGAGAYSDGKLYTRSKKRGNSEKILNVFVQHGASPTILSDAHPHIGTDKLPRVIENMRNTILRCGGEVRFQTRMEGVIIVKSSKFGVQSSESQVAGVKCRDLVNDREVEVLGRAVILATGHSARDVYRWLYANGVEIEAKGLAVGVRLEHPSMLIDQLQYHRREGRGKYLPAAEYNMVQQVDGRGVYSFCMCPGGFVVPAATGPEQIVVNGMSPSGRNGQWSNSGMVVELHPEDIMKALAEEKGSADDDMTADVMRAASDGTVDPLCMMHFQERLERDCWLQGNRKQTAPSQRMADFVNNRLSYDLPRSSYAPGLISSPLHFWMPGFIAHRLQEGFKMFGKRQHGFLTNEATVIGVETRTSSPIRILRDNETLQHIRIRGLFPCGEGAGYAGGIVSAGVDGERCAEMANSFINS